jgi:hypothetical protein
MTPIFDRHGRTTAWRDRENIFQLNGSTPQFCTVPMFMATEASTLACSTMAYSEITVAL